MLSCTILPEQTVDGGSAAVDASQHFSGLAAQMPAQREGVQVGEQTHLNHAVGKLLHSDPQEGSHVADEPGGTCEEARTRVTLTDEPYRSY